DLAAGNPPAAARRTPEESPVRAGRYLDRTALLWLGTALVRRRWFIALTTLATAALAAILIQFVPFTYRAEAVLAFPESRERGPETAMLAAAGPAFLNELAARLGLDGRPAEEEDESVSGEQNFR